MVAGIRNKSDPYIFYLVADFFKFSKLFPQLSTDIKIKIKIKSLKPVLLDPS